MSSVDSSASSGSRLREFGLYRHIDARTEEFLRLSRKRQIRQGCACAAASTAITVTVAIVILLIYEYAIAVEWSLVQRKRSGNGTRYGANITHDSPFADRLDRSYFGFDQDYFERMPLLVNALQESNYIDPLLEMSRPIVRKRYNKTMTTTRTISATDTNRLSKIRRTSPRPFIFEYRSPTPLPFSKTYGSRSWVDSYRNAQRLQNIRQVIKYLEKTINAKMGDMYKTKPSNSHASIAFSGVYVEPMVDKVHNSSTEKDMQTSDMQQQSSDNVESFYTNHQSDPLFNFKPNSPGDVNLLADGLWRFAPVLTPSIIDDKAPGIPMFKKIPTKTYCPSGKCTQQDIDNADSKVVELLQSSEQSAPPPSTKPKSFSLMVNLFPFKSDSNFERPDVKTQPPVEKIYFTTSKPVRFQFRRKSGPVRRNYYRYKKPKYLIQKKNEIEEKLKAKNSETTTQKPDFDTATKMIVHVNVYSPEDKTDMRKKPDAVTEPTTTTTRDSTFTPITDVPFELSSGQVEDFHDGSSGVIPVHERTEPPPLPQITTMIPFFDTDTASTEINTWVTNPPEVIKFGAEDAKVPDQYLPFKTTTQVTTTEMNRRTSVDSLDVEVEHETLIIRLKNEATTTTEEVVQTTEDFEEEKKSDENMTYVPQTNGHYRSLGSRNFSLSAEKNRKKRIEMSVTGFRTYVPMYVEIKRNKTKSTDEND